MGRMITSPQEHFEPEKPVGATPSFMRRVMGFWRRSTSTSFGGGTTGWDKVQLRPLQSVDSLLMSGDFEREREQWDHPFSVSGGTETGESGQETDEANCEAKESVHSRIPPYLRNLDVTKFVTDKQNLMVASGAYCDVFVGRMSSGHTRGRIIHQ